MRGGVAHARASPLSWLREAGPGIVFVAMLAGMARTLAGFVSEWMAGATAAPVSPVLFAVLLGLAWRNCAGIPQWCHEGLRWAAQTLLRVGVALLGLRLTLAGAGEIAVIAVPVAVGCITAALLAGALVSRVLALPPRLRQLLVVGTAICGCSAVAALAPVIRARSAETGFAVASVVLFGTLGMLCYPWVAAAMFESSTLHAGVFLGTAIHDTSQVVGAALIYSQSAGAPEALSAATATKLVRNLAIVVLIPLAVWQSRSPTTGQDSMSGGRHALPGFVVGFLLFVVLRTLGDGHFDTNQSAPLWTDFVSLGQLASELSLIGAMTAIGLSVSIGELRTLGWRPMAGGFVIAVAVAACSLCLTLVSLRWLT